MAATDIAAPVRRIGSQLRDRMKTVSVLTFLLAGLGTVFVFALGWALFVNDPLGGQPVARAALNEPKSRETGEQQAQIRTATDDKDDSPQVPGDRIRLPEESGGQVVISDPIAGAIDGNVDLIEQGRHGPLPKIAADGRKSVDVYARAAPVLAPGQPRIALIVSGLGISAAGTEDAIHRLPADVTLAFAPYGRDLRRLSRIARTDGHELMLQVPLEPYDYPDNDPGPHTLLTTLPERQNIDKLHWVMARMVGYVGMLNHMGAKFVAEEPALAPILTELRNRGVMYLDDGTAPQGKSAITAERLGMSFLKADKVIDANPGRDAIDAELSNLMEIATDRGYAVGIVSALPGSISALEDWIKVLEQKNIAIVPVSALIKTGAS
ncbi:MAG: divergent polysaccharide deacetylase family protein [Rhodobiaceae bacterium]|nr:divergent polysaccharide deacetylase family protein [Rhodobiaceae bacterium]